MSSQLQIRLLGPLMVALDGQPLADSAWRSRQERRLLGALLSAHARTISGDQLIEWLWPESDHHTAAVTLRSAISSLRRTLEPGSAGRASERYILTRPGGYAWNSSGAAWIDVELFMALLIPGNGRRPSTERMEQAIELYQGDYLEDEPEATWALHERERLRGRYLDTLCALAEAKTDHGDCEAGIALAQRGLAREPLHEPLFRALLRAQAGAGDNAGALRSYERYRAALDETLGAAPSIQTRELHSAILRGELERAGKPGPKHVSSSATTQSAPPARPAPPPLVGRKHELEQLEGWVEEWTRGRGGIVLIGGEAGIGKTRLAEEARRMALARGGRSITVRATALERALPFAPLSEALRPLLRSAPDELLRRLPPSALAQVADLLPVVRERRPDLPELPPVPPAERHNRLLDGLVDLALALAQEQPLLIIGDDAQWADEATLTALGRLARRASRQPLLLVVTYRAEELTENPALHALLRSLGRDMLLRPLLLSRFDREEVSQFLAALAHVEPDRTESLASRLTARTGGNPLFLSVAVQALIERHHAPSLAEILPELAHDSPLPDLAGAPQIRDLVLARLADLPEGAQALLEQLAVLGRPASLDLIEQLGGQPAMEAAQMLLERQFLVEGPDERLLFGHDLVRSIIVGALSSPRRRQLHRQVAEAIEQLHGMLPQRAAELTLHFTKGGRGVEASILRYAVIAGDEARRAFGYRQALEHYDAALEAAARLGPGASASDVQRAFAGRVLTYEALLDWDGIIATATQYERWANGRPEASTPPVSSRRLLVLRALMGDLSGAAAISAAGAGIAGQLATHERQHPILEDMLRRTASILQPVSSEEHTTAIPDWSAVAFTHTAPPPGVPDEQLPGLLGRDEAALALFQVGWATLVQGLLRNAEPALLKAHDLAIESGQAAIAVVSALQLAHLHALRGTAGETERWLEHSLELAQRAPESAWAAIWPRIHQGFLWLLNDQYAAAQARFDEMATQLTGLNAFNSHRASLQAGSGLLALAHGDTDRAQILLNDVVAGGQLYGFVYVAAQHGLARLAALRGDLPAARVSLGDALRYSIRRGLLPEYVRTAIEIMRFERDFGDAGSALSLLREAVQLAEQAELGALARVASGLLARLTS